MEGADINGASVLMPLYFVEWKDDHYVAKRIEKEFVAIPVEDLMQVMSDGRRLFGGFCRVNEENIT